MTAKNKLKGYFQLRPHKYRSQRTVVNGLTFPSKLEADLYCYLKSLEKTAEIKQLRQQVSIPLTEAKIRLVVDFEAFHEKLWETVYYEAKGVELPTWRIKRKLWEFYGPGRLFVYKRSGRSSIILTDCVVPKFLTKDKK